MNGILGMTDLALRAELDPTVRDYLETAPSRPRRCWGC